ncbi:MAG TPA: PQQ-binding-like beta-propeller repeat protein [Pyrinomonadaceae bacterium]|nr:PQQ-binding-like beta-propeller repeat protein [Pyrinomonadaceae bacterium]
MNNLPIVEPAVKKPLRLWPGVIAAALLLLLRFIVPLAFPEAEIAGVPAMLIGVMSGVVFGLLIVVWWMFFSRAPWTERLGFLALMIVAMFATSRIIHVSIATGAMGFLFYVLAVPTLTLAFVAALVAARRLSDKTRKVVIAATIILACSAWALVRTGGFTANFDNDFAWRWSKTPEERLLALEGAGLNGPASPAPASTAPAATEAKANWPGFRGTNRDGVVPGARIETNWSTSPPVEIWRRPIGPGWSSFAVDGDLVYTQEQRGDNEVVACYNLITGKPVWKHLDAARFWESNAGAGPRATPTLSNKRVYTFGATGILNALDAGTGAVVWSRNAAADTKTKVPGWGFSSSPLVVGDVVVVATAGTLAGYDAATGTPRWTGPNGGSGYSSPHLVTIQGVPQVLMLGSPAVVSVAPADGKVLWQHQLSPSARIVQPAVTPEGDVLVHDGEGNAMRRIAATNGASGWTVQERWESFGINPYFNDFIIHKGHAFGFSGSGIACIDLKDGERKWKGGNFGNGQLIVLPDQDLLIVLSEQGELALVGATPGQFTELARFPAIKGKTWNHPVLAGDVLLVRNGEEMAAFRLKLTSG